MPLRKSASSLEQLCLKMVCTNFDSFQTQLVDQPSSFIYNVYKYLSDNFDPDTGNVIRVDANVFLHAATKSLHNFDMFYQPVYPTLLLKIEQVCGNLLRLDLSYKSDVKIPPEHLVKLLQKLSQLQSVTFANRTECTDEVLAAIGKNCLQLRYLDISWCINVTDNGLYSLDDCKNLEHLHINQNFIITPIACFYILNQLLLLKTFRHRCWSNLVYLLLQQHRSEKALHRSYSIETIPIVSTNSTECVLILTNIFPNLSSLALSALGRLNLNIVLESNRLTSLQLYNLGLVNLTHIDYYCPMLQHLGLKYCSIRNTVSVGDLAKRTLFENLRAISLNVGENGITEAQMAMLIAQSQNLERVTIGHCNTVPDMLICKLKNLNSVAFNVCASINQSMVIKLLEMQNPMKFLVIENCFNINASVYEEICMYIESKNLDVEFTWRHDVD